MKKYKNGDLVRTVDGWRFVIVDASHQDKGTVVACPEGHMQYPTSVPIRDIKVFWTKKAKIAVASNAMLLAICVICGYFLGDNPYLWLSVMLGAIVAGSVVNIAMLLGTD